VNGVVRGVGRQCGGGLSLAARLGHPIAAPEGRRSRPRLGDRGGRHGDRDEPCFHPGQQPAWLLRRLGLRAEDFGTEENKAG